MKSGVDVAISAVLADAKEMKQDYEPIPDPNWIKILPEHFHLGPGASAAARTSGWPEVRRASAPYCSAQPTPELRRQQRELAAELGRAQGRGEG